MLNQRVFGLCRVYTLKCEERIAADITILVVEHALYRSDRFSCLGPRRQRAKVAAVRTDTSGST